MQKPLINIPISHNPQTEAVADEDFPRRTYDDEGKWKIIRQNENKQHERYQYL